MDNRNIINQQILKNYSKENDSYYRVNRDLEKIMERKNEEKSLASKIAVDILKGIVELILKKKNLFDSIDMGKAYSKCFGIALVYQPVYIISSTLNYFKVQNSFSNKVNDSRESLEKNFEYNIKEAMPLLSMTVDGSRHILSEAIYYIDKKNGKVKNIKNISESMEYLNSFKQTAINEFLQEIVPTYLSSVSEYVQEKVFPNNNEAYSLYAKASVEAVEEAINNLKIYKLKQIELVNELANKYNEFISYDNGYYNQIEEMIDKIEKNISVVLEECTKSIYILSDKKLILESYQN